MRADLLATESRRARPVFQTRQLRIIGRAAGPAPARAQGGWRFAAASAGQSSDHWPAVVEKLLQQCAGAIKRVAESLEGHVQREGLFRIAGDEVQLELFALAHAVHEGRIER